MERGDDRKKRRVMEMVIVERVKQGLPLQKDALEYLIAYFNLDSLNNFCSTSWTMQQFCHNNQIWRKKFARHIPGPGHWLQTIKREQWLHYWDFSIYNTVSESIPLAGGIFERVPTLPNI
jgi:hypothetical protein